MLTTKSTGILFISQNFVFCRNWTACFKSRLISPCVLVCSCTLRRSSSLWIVA